MGRMGQFLDGSCGSQVNLRSLVTHACLFQHMYHTVMIMAELQ